MPGALSKSRSTQARPVAAVYDPPLMTATKVSLALAATVP